MANGSFLTRLKSHGRRKLFALPMKIGVGAQLPLGGKNVPKGRSINLEYKVFF